MNYKRRGQGGRICICRYVNHTPPPTQSTSACDTHTFRYTGHSIQLAYVYVFMSVLICVCMKKHSVVCAHSFKIYMCWKCTVIFACMQNGMIRIRMYMMYMYTRITQSHTFIQTRARTHTHAYKHT